MSVRTGLLLRTEFPSFPGQRAAGSLGVGVRTCVFVYMNGCVSFLVAGSSCW